MPECTGSAYLVMSVNAHANVPRRLASSSVQRWKWTAVNVHCNKSRTEMHAGMLVPVCCARREFWVCAKGGMRAG